MSDITMCKGTGCPAKEDCFRYTAPVNEHRQAYFMEPPIKDGKCEMYWGVRQTYLFDMLKDIVNGNENKSDGQDE
jgi:hypothetical protein